MAIQSKVQKKKAVVYIHKDRFDYYDEAQSQIFQFQFQPNVVSDIEILDEESLKTQIKSFIDTNKLQPANIFFVIADDIIFEKNFPITTDKSIEIQKYLENIPFEHVSYKVDTVQKEYIVIAMNKELYWSLKNSFEPYDFTALGVIPQSTLGLTYKARQSLDSDMIKYILTHLDQLKKQVFIEEDTSKPDEHTNSPGAPSNLSNQQKPNKYRLPVLIGIFVILIGILIVVIYFQFQPPKPSPLPPSSTTPSK